MAAGVDVALGKYVAMLDAATGPAMVRAALTKATADKGLFVFGELLDHPKVSLVRVSGGPGGVRAVGGSGESGSGGGGERGCRDAQLSGTADAGWIRVLEIFAYDTYGEYSGA
jgi:hypothetical protein